MRFHAADPDSWQAALADALPGPFRGHPSFSLYSAVAETSVWAERAPTAGWRNPANAQSLQADVQAGMAFCGAGLRGLFDTAGQALVEALEQVAVSAKLRRDADRAAGVASLRGAAEQAEALLQSAPLRVALWQDLTEAARADRPDLRVIEDGTALLNAMLIGAGIDPDDRFGRLADILAPSVALPEAERDRLLDCADAERVQAGAAVLEEAPVAGECVVWLTFAEARLPEFVFQMGPVTFFDADWCIPNALRSPGQEYPHRDELARVIAHDHQRSILDPNAAPRREVLARVELGDRPLHGWEDEAAAQVRAAVAVVASRTGAAVWRRAGFSCLVVDGEARTYSVGPGDRPLFTDPDHYGMRGFADALAEYSAELAGLLAIGRLPVDVAEALRLLGEAGQVDSRENALNGTATIAEQTVIVLQVAALERLSANARMDSREFISALAEEWALARYHQSIAWAVEHCLAGVGGGGNPLFHRVVTFPSGRRRLSFPAAFEVRDDLVAACRGRFERARAETVLASIGDPSAAAALLSQFAAESGVLRGRLTRCRNGLMHGNPVFLESVLSVRAFSRFLVRIAFDDAIRSITERRPVADLFGDAKRQWGNTMARISSGVSFYEIWKSASESS